MKAGQLNRDYIHQYKTVFADQLIAKKYEGKTHLSGKELLQLTPVKQLNLFILKTLFTAWQEEMKQLESPYFDYKNADVRKNMVQFMNELSQHIRIAAKDLKPLITIAVEKTFVLVVSPAEFLTEELENKNGVIKGRFIKQFIKYLAFHKSDFSTFLNLLENQPFDLALNQADDFFSKIDKEDSIKELVDGVSEILVIENKDFLVPSISTGTEEIIPDIDSEEEFEKEEDDDNLIADSQIENDESEDESEETVEAEEESEDSEDIASEEETELADEVESKEEVNGEEDFVEVAESVEAVDQQEGVLQSISESHQYMFVQELFGGDSQKFHDAIAHVEEYESFDEAVEYLVQSYAKDLDWNMNSDEVKELLKVIFRKFR